MRIGPVWMSSRAPDWRGAPSLDDRTAGLRHLRRCGVRLLNLAQPDPVAARQAGYRQVMTGATLAIVPLDRPLRDNMQQKWRNRLWAGLANPITVESRNFTLPADQWLLAADRIQQRQRGYRGYPCRFLAQLALHGMTRLFLCHFAGEVIAAMLMAQHGSMASYLIGWTGPVGRRTHAHNVLMDAAMHYYQSLGLRALDLGTIDTQAAAGLARFKLGTGAQPSLTGGTWIGFGNH